MRLNTFVASCPTYLILYRCENPGTTLMTCPLYVLSLHLCSTVFPTNNGLLVYCFSSIGTSNAVFTRLNKFVFISSNDNFLYFPLAIFIEKLYTFLSEWSCFRTSLLNFNWHCNALIISVLLTLYEAIASSTCWCVCHRP